MFKKYLSITILTFVTWFSFAQRAQRIAYVDMAFVLENIPDYIKAQNQLDTKVKSWQKRLDREKDDIKALKKDFSNEKPLLTPELIQEREDDIYFKEQEYHQLQEAYFGPKGDLYLYRKLLVQPIQDKVYNAIQDIALKKRYDFVVDKSSDLILLYTNKRYDISDLVVNSIIREQKKEAILAKRSRLKKRKNHKKNKIAKTPDKHTKPSTAISKTQNLPNNNLKATTKVKPDETKVLKNTPSDAVLKRIEARNAKRKLLLEKIKKANLAKAKKQEEERKAAKAKRAKRLEEVNKYKKELIRKRDSAIQAKRQKKLKQKENKNN